MDEKTESMRQLVDMAVACGRKRKSTQTGYLHHCHGLNEQEPHLPIPLVENFLYALALVRSRTIENINEAKGILEGLLHFQNCSSSEFAFGNFPIYMHDYPVCKDRFTGVHVAAAICCILKQFQQVIGQELRPRLEKALGSAVKHALKTYAEKPGPYTLAVKLAATAVAAGRLLGDKQVEAQGTELLDLLPGGPDETSWYCPEEMGEVAAALLLVYPKLGDSPWKEFWEHLHKTWHRSTGSYAGPALKEWQQCEEPQTTLYELFMGYLSGMFSARAKKDALVHLEAALICPCDDILPPEEYPSVYDGKFKGTPWMMRNEGKYVYCSFDHGSVEVNPVFAKGYHPFKLLWGDLMRTHTFVCQDGNAKAIHFFNHASGQLEADFDLGDLIEFEDRENSREVAFFTDVQEGIEFLVGGGKSSTFVPDEPLMLHCGGLKLHIVFTVKSGEGRFLGHRMMGNRPSQIGAKGPARYNAYDWQIFLRTVRRSEECRIGLTMKIELS